MLPHSQVCPRWNDIVLCHDMRTVNEAIGDVSTCGEDLLLRPLPEIVVVESLDSPFQAETSDSDTSCDSWSLRSDPGECCNFHSLCTRYKNIIFLSVLRHCYHMVNHDYGVSYIVSIPWLAEALLSVQASTKGSNLTSVSIRPHIDENNRIAELKNASALNMSPASVIPVYPSTSVTSSKSYRHPLTAFRVLFDPTYGHYALFRTGTKAGISSKCSVSSINLTVLLTSIAQENRLMVRPFVFQYLVFTTFIHKIKSAIE